MPELSTAVHAADAEAAAGNLAGARDLLVDAVDAARATLGPDDLEVLAAQARLAAVLRELGALPEARRVLESMLEAGCRTHGANHPQLLLATHELAVLAHELGNFYEAGRNFQLLSQHGPAALGADHHHVLAARRYLGEDVPGEIDAPPPLPLPPVGPPPGEPILAGRERRWLPAALAVASMALVALMATLVAVWAIPQRDPRPDPPSLAAPAGPIPSADAPSTSSSASVPPSGTATGPGLPVPGGTRTPPRSTPSTTAPAAIAGRYVIHVAHTGLCLGEGPELFVNSGRTVLGQHTCGSSLPQFTIEPVASNVYRILVAGRDGTGCADVDYQGTEEGLLLAAQTCTGAADQRFTLEPVTTPAAGYRLRSVAGSKFCIGVLEQKQERGVQIMQDTCRGSKAEVFTLERR
ncbi:tetratricopeptide repeat protein [Dactylosporangium siamense]|uniref:RICIN domain-containing protein n=1 Tax=Dactylosporangium siamense TaxID=685454 RepID=UPI0019419DAE|nr:RICIN domain-containing protein [Dactylosporangium siamense]